MKKRPIQPHEKYYIEQNPDNLTPDELATMFSRTVQVVRNIIAKHSLKTGKRTVTRKSEPDFNQLSTSAPPLVEVVSQPSPKGINIDPLFAKVKRNGQNIGAIMTKEASEASDEARKQNHKPLSSALKGSIHKCKG